MAVLLNEGVPWVPLKVNYFFLNDDQDKKFNFIPRLVNGNWSANPRPLDLGFETRPVWLTERQRQLENNFWVERVLAELFCCTYLYIDIFWIMIGIPSNVKSMKRQPSKNFYHRTFCVSFTNAVFWTSRFCLKNTAIEISSILRMSFPNMFLNSDFTNSNEDEILNKIHTWNKVTPTHKNFSFLQSKWRNST